MPLYEYQCKKCHHRFERIQKFSDPHVKKCPDCGGPVEQVISAPAVQFKGSGWYVTDYAKKSSSGTGSGSSSNGDSASKNESGGKKDDKEKKESKTEGSSKTESSSKKKEQKA
jgi:putative FmdB family regulatory protein